MVMLVVGLFYNLRIGDAKRFPHLQEAGPVVAGPLAPAVEAAEDDATARGPVTPQTV